MNCPKCTSANLTLNGTNALGTQLYHCKDCSKYFPAVAHKRGKKPIGKKPMSSTERSRKRREKLKLIEAKSMGNNTQKEGYSQSGFRICWVGKNETRDDITPEQAASRKGTALYSKELADKRVAQLNSEYPELIHFAQWDTADTQD